MNPIKIKTIKIKPINPLQYEATKTCGRMMFYELYHDLNVWFKYPYWVYQLLTDKYMLDILIAIEKRKQELINNKEYFIKEQKKL